MIPDFCSALLEASGDQQDCSGASLGLSAHLWPHVRSTTRCIKLHSDALWHGLWFAQDPEIFGYPRLKNRDLAKGFPEGCASLGHWPELEGDDTFALCSAT